MCVLQSATEKEIKKTYRKLTMQFHPDKVQLDTSKNQTLDDVNAFYVEISKAYKALTDDEIRNNYLQYGHPDGKQSFSIGIALPKFIITDGNGKYVILAYAMLLGVLLPYIVGKWWYGTQRMTKEKVLVATAGKLFREWEEDLTDGRVINALSTGEEYTMILSGNKADDGLGKIEKAVLAEGEKGQTVAGLTSVDQQKLQAQDGVRRKTLALLWAYLGRIDLKDLTLNDEKFEVAPIALQMNESFITICLSYGPLIPLLGSFHASQSLIQAIPPNGSPLLQLPHLTPAVVRAIEGKEARRHMTLQQFMELPEATRRKLATDGSDKLTPKQFEDAMSVAAQIPLVKVEKCFFKVLGERHITPGSLVQCVIKCRVIPPGTKNVPEVYGPDLEDIDPDEEDLEGLLGRKPAKNSRTKNADGTVADIKEVQPPLAYAPYFARDHSPRWHLLLSESRQNRVAVPPTTITTFNKPIFNEDGTPTFNMQTMKLQFQAPNGAGTYSFVMHLVCDSYIGMDTQTEATLIIEDSAKAAEIESEEEISEPEEGDSQSDIDARKYLMLMLHADSLAGQMNALKTGGLTGPPPKKKKSKVAETSDDDDSDTDGSVADDTSETDTDTDSD
jgi:translocation protein SEC63